MEPGKRACRHRARPGCEKRDPDPVVPAGRPACLRYQSIDIQCRRVAGRAAVPQFQTVHRRERDRSDQDHPPDRRRVRHFCRRKPRLRPACAFARGRGILPLLYGLPRRIQPGHAHDRTAGRFRERWGSRGPAPARADDGADRPGPGPDGTPQRRHLPGHVRNHRQRAIVGRALRGQPGGRGHPSVLGRVYAGWTASAGAEHQNSSRKGLTARFAPISKSAAPTIPTPGTPVRANH